MPSSPRQQQSLASIAHGNFAGWEEREANKTRKPDPVFPVKQQPRPLLRLKSCQCRWPVKNAPKVTGGFLFCSRVTAYGDSYCEVHKRMTRPG